MLIKIIERQNVWFFVKLSTSFVQHAGWRRKRVQHHPTWNKSYKMLDESLKPGANGSNIKHPTSNIFVGCWMLDPFAIQFLQCWMLNVMFEPVQNISSNIQHVLHVCAYIQHPTSNILRSNVISNSNRTFWLHLFIVCFGFDYFGIKNGFRKQRIRI